MDFVVLVAGSKDSSGFCEIDQAGITQTTNYKQSTAKKNGVALIGRDGAAFSGISTHQGDYLAVAQAEKPALVLYQRGKSSPLFQCPMQEIVNCLTTDIMGTYLYSGTRKGFVYVHDIRTGELVTMWQAHLKAVTKLQLTGDSQFLVSVGEDGLGRCWNVPSILDPALTQQHGLLKAQKSNENRLLSPFRSWNAHTLPVTDVCLIDFGSCLRAVTCSVDRTVHFYDILHQSSLAKVTLPGDFASPLECLSLTNGLEYALAGSSTGKVFSIDISVVAAGVSAVQHSTIVGGASARRTATTQPSTSAATGIHTIDAHSLAVSSILVLPDNERFVTGSLDGYVKFYHIFTRQLLAECTPLLQRGPVTNLLWMYRAESSSLAIVKPTIAAVAPLKKYVDSAGNSTGAAVAAAAAAANNATTTVSTAFSPTLNVPEKIASVVGQAHTQGLSQGSVVLGPTFVGVSAEVVFHAQERSLRSLRDYGELMKSSEDIVIEGEEDEEAVASSGAGIDAEEEFIRLPEKVSKASSVPTKPAKKLTEKGEKRQEKEEDDDDIMRFDVAANDDDEDDEADDDDEAADEEDDDEDEEEEDDSEALRELLQSKDEEIAALQEESQRWKTLCDQMKQYIEESKQATGGKRSRDETPASTAVSTKKTSENPSKKQKKGGK